MFLDEQKSRFVVSGFRTSEPVRVLLASTSSSALVTTIDTKPSSDLQKQPVLDKVEHNKHWEHTQNFRKHIRSCLRLVHWPINPQLDSFLGPDLKLTSLKAILSLTSTQEQIPLLRRSGITSHKIWHSTEKNPQAIGGLRYRSPPCDARPSSFSLC